jgi:cholesterol transport system auxiliary component
MKTLVSTLSAALLLGCSLTSKSEPITPRYFTPERTESAGGEQAAARGALIASPGPALALQLGRVDAASYLREYIAYRDSEHELGFYDDRRWSEQPDAYLRRALEQALFERRGLTRVFSAAAPELNVELTAFDEVRKPQHGVLCKVRLVLVDGGSARLEETVVVEERLNLDPNADAAAAVAQALAVALDSAVQRIADRVVDALHQLRAEAASPPVPQPVPEPVPAP